MSDGATTYWYCVKHQTVEQGEDVCPPIDRLGPFDSHDEAARALELARQRNEEWDDDPRWNDED